MHTDKEMSEKSDGFIKYTLCFSLPLKNENSGGGRGFMDVCSSKITVNKPGTKV